MPSPAKPPSTRASSAGALPRVRSRTVFSVWTITAVGALSPRMALMAPPRTHAAGEADDDAAAAGQMHRRRRGFVFRTFAARHLAFDVDDRRPRIVHQHRPARGAGHQLAGAGDDQRAAAGEVNGRVRPARHRALHPDHLIGIRVRESDEVVGTHIRGSQAGRPGARTSSRSADPHPRWRRRCPPQRR